MVVSYGTSAIQESKDLYSMAYGGATCLGPTV